MENIDLIFMDITLPKLDGLAVLKKFRELGISIPTVIITGYGIMQNAIKAMQLGVFDYLTKPLDIQKIREITQKVFPKSSDTNTIKENHPSLNADIVDRYDLIGEVRRCRKFIN